MGTTLSASFPGGSGRCGELLVDQAIQKRDGGKAINNPTVLPLPWGWR